MTYSYEKLRKILSGTIFFVLLGFAVLNFPAACMVLKNFGHVAFWAYIIISTVLFFFFGMWEIAGWVMVKIITANENLMIWALMIIPIVGLCILPIPEILPKYIGLPLACCMGFILGFVTSRFVRWSRIRDVEKQPETESK